MRPIRACFFAGVAVLLLRQPEARGQGLGALVSPGPLSRPHAQLEGLANCQKCHEPGRKVTTAKCLACHEPIAKRIAEKTGVHRKVSNDCVACHAEHAGSDAELRPFETKGFDHAAETGFPLEGLHAPPAVKCASCHKARSFLGLQTACASCHADIHKGVLGTKCATCHPMNVAFKDTKTVFDHTRTRYPLTGAHAKVACANCHPQKDYRVARFAACDDCHRNPHQPPLGTCASCHVTDSFRTITNGKFDHSRTSYPLLGRHATTRCESCHVQPAGKVRVKAALCADCHKDVHGGAFRASREDCAACHTETAFKGGRFDHTRRTKYPLTGKHLTVPCASCHKGVAATPGVPPAKRTVLFGGAKSECRSCHEDVHRGQLGADCQTCHSTAGFKIPEYRHPRSPEFFPGGHAGIACEKCHGVEASGGLVRTSGNASVPVRKYRGVSFVCSTCHKDPHLGQVGPDCAACHSLRVKGYVPDLFVHSRSKFPLTGKHATAPCANCHKKESGSFPAGNGTAVRLTGVETECRACHKDVHLGQLGAKCETCHGTTTFSLPKYVHPARKETADLFFGGHARLECAACHKKQTASFPAGRGMAVRYRPVAVECASCHADPHRPTLGSNCASCHTVAIWKTASRAFHKASVFPLEGRHIAVPCASCHIKGVIKTTPTACYDCHWVRRQDDKYKTRLGNECQSCHGPNSWAAVRWDHLSRTGFELSTPHRTVPCENCHTGAVFRPMSTDCVSCHQADYNRAQNPNHVAGGFPLTCQSCHSVSSPTWQGATFSHVTFPLAGVHLTQACATCHKNNVYKGTPRDCYTCHQADYQRSVNPPHVAAGFSAACDSCHRFSDPAWKPASFNHSTLTTFALAGVHATQACATCHKNNVYKGTPRDCYTCHQADYQRSVNPPHVAAGFSTACDSCHRFADPAWKPASFNHSTSTTFPLAGVHVTQTCTTCHKNNVYKGTPRDCYTCHQADYQKSVNPPHVAAGFPTVCDSCHKFSDAAWQGAMFAHTTFPLAGTHLTQACATCHKNNVYKGTPRDCYTCHQADYQKSANPNHVAAGFPTTCDTCHKFADPAWKPTSFNHNTATTFPLAGVHVTQTCATCHKNSVYKGTPRDCYACHQADYQKSVNPPHVAAGFPTTCDTCHKFADPAWKPASFSHSTATTFPLVGVHATQPCAACHSGGVYKGLSTLCSACHLPLYTATKTPPHAATSFPTTCDNCHKATDPTWLVAVFNHTTSTTFPLVGVHATQACAACHSSGVYKGLSTLCSSCHMPLYTATKTPPHATTGFPTTCNNCHKATDPTWLVAVFNHTTSTTFPLVGVHATQTCAACHSSGVYRGLSTLCSSCHLPLYTATRTPPHAATGFPTTCDNCHKATDPNWLVAVFNHTWFPITSGNHRQTCATCHTTPTNYALFTCTQCHTASTTTPHHSGVRGYVWNSVNCYACHPNGRAG